MLREQNHAFHSYGLSKDMVRRHFFFGAFFAAVSALRRVELEQKQLSCAQRSEVPMSARCQIDFSSGDAALNASNQD